PVTDPHPVTLAAAGDHPVRPTPTRSVVHVDHLPAPHRDRVPAITVPVTDQHLIGEPPVHELMLRTTPSPTIRQEEPEPLTRRLGDVEGERVLERGVGGGPTDVHRVRTVGRHPLA